MCLNGYAVQVDETTLSTHGELNENPHARGKPISTKLLVREAL